MRASSVLSLAFISLSSAALPKANEYKSGDCSGPLNYGHNSALLGDVTMDDTTHSVYITRDFIGFEGKTKDGGSCQGALLAIMAQGCNNIDSIYPGKRIRCVRYVQ